MKKANLVSKRGALYIRMLPRCATSRQGKLHVHTVPVKPARAQYNGRAEHPALHFTAAVSRMVKEFLSWLGPKYSVYFSPDDKCLIPMAIPAAVKQQKIIMRMDAPTVLADHQFAVKGHKIIPAVDSYCEVKSNMPGRKEAITYSGPTVVTCRSAMFDSSTAQQHLYD